MSDDDKKFIEDLDKYRLLAAASQYQGLRLQLENMQLQSQVLQRDMLTAHVEVEKKARELLEIREGVAKKYGVDLAKQTLDPNTGEFIPIPEGLPFPVQKG